MLEVLLQCMDNKIHGIKVLSPTETVHCKWNKDAFVDDLDLTLDGKER